jgi:hypothetical protein
MGGNYREARWFLPWTKIRFGRAFADVIAQRI